MKYLLLQGLRWCMLSMAVSASAQVSTPVASTQLPTGGKVVTGTASIQSVGNVLNINQSSQRSAINWNTFNVGSGAKVNFIQPSASSVTLNRVLDTNGSQILGSISANGQVFISNPNGVLFGPNSQVNVGGLIATTQNISVDDFMAGKSTFEGTGAAGAVVNQGTLEAALGGYIALLAPSVRNEGVVLAREGTVAFAASDKTVVQFNGPQLVTVMVDKPVLDALVENKQMVRADGGLVIFSARSANAVLSSVIRNTGTVQANTIVNKQGRIMLEGGTQGVVEVGGTLQASGIDAGTQGGTISATGDKVSVVSGALLEATGQAGGGNVLVGGGWQGSDPTIQSANAVNIASGAVLNASAIQNGKGGTVVAWSDTQNSAGVTKVQGTLLARGGAEGGDGGRIETSGRWISTGGASGDASAAKGNGGQWLFDPYDVDIISTPGVTNQATNTANTWSPVGNSSTILNSDITSLLNAGTSVTVLVPTTGGGGLSGNIKVSAPIIQQAASPSANLTLSAYRNLLIDQPITLSGSTGTLQLTAGTGSSALGYISIDNAITANTVSVDNFASGPVTQSFPISANNLRISAPLSNVTLNDTSNQIGALAANVQSLSIKTNQGVDRGSLYGSGMAVGVVGDLTGVTATGDIAMSVMNGNLFVDKSITTTSTTTTALKLNAGASLNTGAYSGSNSVNNPYGPNIILAN
ncbi:MAG: filamentous hemagglutinin N-terminal domain-containing protein, partial [Burkholderiales bacterium]|nr:filamentous hemagglutinin N-terminal domain-containing protein [Burkholderiales bacterium]